MQQLTDSITIPELKGMASKMFGNLVKAVVDVEKGIIVLDADLHSDQEQFLLTQGSNQENLWGINIYPDLKGNDRIEFDSMINLRPSQGNMSRGVDSTQIQQKILKIVNNHISE